MEKDDKGSTMIPMGVSGRMFLLVPAYPGCPGSKAVKRSLLLLLLTTFPLFNSDLSKRNGRLLPLSKELVIIGHHLLHSWRQNILIITHKLYCFHFYRIVQCILSVLLCSWQHLQCWCLIHFIEVWKDLKFWLKRNGWVSVINLHRLLI